MNVKDKKLKKMVDVNRVECPELDCYNPCEWKGSITPGIGYSYAPKSQWHYTCLTRDNHGCPTRREEIKPPLWINRVSID